MKRLGMLVVSLWDMNQDSGVTWGVHDKMPLFLATKLTLRVHSKNNKL